MKLILTFFCYFLTWLCDLCHRLPQPHEENLQGLFITVFDTHCPFAHWSYLIDTKFNLGTWIAQCARYGADDICAFYFKQCDGFDKKCLMYWCEGSKK